MAMSGSQMNAQREAEARAAGIKPPTWPAMLGMNDPKKPAGCYTADVVGGKYVCPICKQVEGGIHRIITHYFNCPNKGGEYCQKGGRRRATRKSRRKIRKSSRRSQRR